MKLIRQKGFVCLLTALICLTMLALPVVADDGSGARITAQPVGGEVIGGVPITLSVTAEPTSPTGGVLEYEWYKDGEPIENNSDTMSVNQAGTYHVKVHVQGSNFWMQSDDAIVTVHDCFVEFVTESLPGGLVGEAYSAEIEVNACDEPVEITLSDGSLPAGLTLANGIISGTLTAPGSFTFKLLATVEQGQTPVGGGHSAEEEKEFTLVINREHTLEIPFTKTVEQNGTKAPGKETVLLEVFEPEMSDAQYAILSATLETDGKGSFNGVLKIKVANDDELGNLSEGFYVQEKKGSAAGWTYSDAVWYVAPVIGSDGTIESYTIHPVIGGEIQQNSPQEKMSFNNIYDENEPIESKPSAEIPKTGDSNHTLPLIGLLLLSGSALIGVTRNKKKKKSYNK